MLLLLVLLLPPPPPLLSPVLLLLGVLIPLGWFLNNSVCSEQHDSAAL
jgi:hypothetical protein